MTQRLDCGQFRMAAVDEEKVVVRKGGLTLAPASGKIERSADAFPVRHHRTSWRKRKAAPETSPGDRRDKACGSGKKRMVIG